MLGALGPMPGVASGLKDWMEPLVSTEIVSNASTFTIGGRFEVLRAEGKARFATKEMALLILVKDV